jgi:phosphatidylglycerophosphate synthase
LNRKQRKRSGGNSGVSFARCVLASAGLLFCGFPVWIASSVQQETDPSWIGAVLAVFFFIGLFLVLAAILGSQKQVDSILDSAGNHDGALVFLILAVPIYLILKFCGRRGK